MPVMSNNQSIAEGNLLGMYTHDAERCDAGQPCAMCQWASEQERTPTTPTFADDWRRAPRAVIRLVTVADAEYWWTKGQQAGRLAEQVETRRWLVQMMEGYGERINRDS